MDERLHPWSEYEPTQSAPTDTRPLVDVDTDAGYGLSGEEDRQRGVEITADTSLIGTAEDYGSNSYTGMNTAGESIQALDAASSSDVGVRSAEIREYGGETDRSAAGFPETDVYDRVRRLGLPPEDSILISSGAIEVVVGPEARRAGDIGLTVSAEAYRYLRNHRDMQELVAPDGSRRLVGDGYDVGEQWNDSSFEELQRNAYSNRGVNIVDLPAVYKYKQQQGSPEDLADLEIIRKRLYSAETLPPEMLQDELSFVRGCMPEHLRARPELRIAANGLYIVSTVFGGKDGTFRTYSGEIEQAAVPAMFHAWGHSAYGARDGQRNIDVVEEGQRRQGLPSIFSDDDRVDAITGYTNHDIILGHGRYSANPAGHDEKQSAEHLVRQMERMGIASPRRLQTAYNGVIVTTWNETKKSQNINPTRGDIPVQENNAGSDFSSFRRSDGPLASILLVVEDFFRVGAGYDKPLARLQDTLNSNLPEGARRVCITTAHDGLRLIDRYPNFPVTFGNPPRQATLREAAIVHVTASAKITADYQFPPHWKLGGAELQVQNAAFLRHIAAKLNAGMPFSLAFEEAEKYHRALMAGLPYRW